MVVRYLLIANKLPEFVKIQADAIKIDKITFWDNRRNGKAIKSLTTNSLSDVYKSVPPLQEMFNMAGMDLPEYLKGKDKPELESDDAEIEKSEEK